MSTETAADALGTLRACTASILRRLARAEAKRLEKLATMAEHASRPEEIHAIIGTAARGAMTVVPRRPDWRERAVFLLGWAQEDTLPDNWGCCADIEPCGDHADRFAVSGFLGAVRDAVKDADGPEDAGMRIAEIIAGGGPR